MGYDFSSLSPVDFEELCGDLLTADRGIAYSRYKPGRDRGIDLRCQTTADSGGDILQAKHYLGSGYAALLRDMKKEREKVEKLEPARYTLTTSVPLSPDQQDELLAVLAPYTRGTEDVLGQGDLNALLGRYPDVERRHFKLWLSSVEVLTNVVHSDVVGRSRDFVEHLEDDVRRFVSHAALSRAETVLREERICLLSGIPGIGKSTVAKMLIAHLAAEGCEANIISEDIREAEAVFRDDNSPQVFYYDDFLGTTAIEESLGKNEDHRLTAFIGRVRRNPAKKLILTTREYVFRQAREHSEILKRARLDLRKVIVRMQDYDLSTRADILFNHLYFSGLDHEYLKEFVDSGAYWSVLRHANYSPRLIEQVIELASIEGIQPTGFAAFFRNHLDRPAELWSHVFEQHLTPESRSILFTLFALGGHATTSELRRASSVVDSQPNRPIGDLSLEQALRPMEGTFISTRQSQNFSRDVQVNFANPSIRDYLTGVVAESPAVLQTLITRAEHFEQLVYLSRFAAEEDLASLFGDQANAALRAAVRSHAPEVKASLIRLAVSPEMATQAKASGQLILRRLAELVRQYPDVEASLLEEAFSVCLERWREDGFADADAVDHVARLFSAVETSPSLAEIGQLVAADILLDLSDLDDYRLALQLAEAEGLLDPEDESSLHARYADYLETEVADLCAESEYVDEETDYNSLSSLLRRADDILEACFSADLPVRDVPTLEDHVEDWRSLLPDDSDDMEHGGWDRSSSAGADIDSQFRLL